MIFPFSADLPRSASRRFWPSGRRTTLERFSDGIVLTFPPSCSHMTDGWRMQTCKTNGDDCDIRSEGKKSLVKEQLIAKVTLQKCSKVVETSTAHYPLLVMANTS